MGNLGNLRITFLCRECLKLIIAYTEEDSATKDYWESQSPYSLKCTGRKQTTTHFIDDDVTDIYKTPAFAVAAIAYNAATRCIDFNTSKTNHDGFSNITLERASPSSTEGIWNKRASRTT